MEKKTLSTGIIGYEDIEVCKTYGIWFVKEKKGKWGRIDCPLEIAKLEKMLRS